MGELGSPIELVSPSVRCIYAENHADRILGNISKSQEIEELKSTMTLKSWILPTTSCWQAAARRPGACITTVRSRALSSI